jgi:F-type H+-transporting ATPase subunit delta
VKQGASDAAFTVTNRTAALRYARALFDVVRKEGSDLAQVESELVAFSALLKGHATLDQVLLNPAVPAPRKRSIVGLLVARARVQAIVGKLFVLLAERDRLAVLPDLIAAYRERLLEHRRVVRAEVTTAVALPAGRTLEISRALEMATGREVALSTRVDPEIIGGVVARVGGTVYDASITRQLEKMRQRLLEGQ